MTPSGIHPASRAPLPSHNSDTSRAAWWVIAACAGVVLSLVWDFSWESTVGVDRVWAPPHVATALAVAWAGLTAIGQIVKRSTSAAEVGQGVRLGPWRGPLGAWVSLWGVLAFGTALGFDGWWQSAYGLEAGIWHPPQWLKASSFFALLLAAATLAVRADSGPSTRGAGVGGAMVGALALMLISVVTLPITYANRQHSNLFYQIAAGAYPLVLTAVIVACPGRAPATRAALIYMLGLGAMVWVLPLFPARPLTGPVYHALDHLMPPPFPLLLVAPALALDGLSSRMRGTDWRASVAFGVLFFIVFLGAQWLFAEFLLSSLADNRFFAGGGRHWPFFLKIDELARTEFWHDLAPELNLSGALLAAGLAVISAQAGLWLGGWLKDLQR